MENCKVLFINRQVDVMKDFKHKLLAVMQHVVIVNRKEVLLLRYSNYQGQGVEGLWGLPGGHYMSGDPTEDLEEGGPGGNRPPPGRKPAFVEELCCDVS